MSGWEATAAGWLLRSALGGGSILLLAWWWAWRTRQPLRQLRLGVWGLTAALVVAAVAALPGWLVVSVPVPVEAAPVDVTPDEMTAQPSEEALAMLAWLLTWPERELTSSPEPTTLAVAPATSPPPAPATGWVWMLALPTWLTVAYFGVASALLARWAFGHLLLWRLVRQSRPAPWHVVRLFQETTGGANPTRLLVSDRLPTPISCGLLRPVIVLPRSMCGDPGALRWVFAHELAHVNNRDLWTCWLFSLGEVVFFYLPWFWWQRRQVRLCQEYLADAAVLDQDDAPADYAQFLINLSTAPPLPAGATGVSGRPSELFRRVRMMLQRPLVLERTCPGFWSCSVAAVLVGLAVLAGGLRLTAQAPEAEPALAPPQPAEPVAEPTIPEPPEKVTPPTPPQAAAAKSGRFNLRTDNALGIKVERAEPALIDQLGLPRGSGLIVLEVTVPRSPAAQAGLKRHDVIVAIGGLSVSPEPRDLNALTRRLPVNQGLDVQVLRKGQPVTLKGLTLTEAEVSLRPAPVALGLGGAVAAPARFGFGPPAGETTLINQNGRSFQARQTEGPLSVSVTGALADGKCRHLSVTVVDAGTVRTFDDVGRVAEPYRERVQRLIDMVERGAKSP